ncbi:MAG: GNAT family N-acetyltransferase [Chloroflexi bacterium]|nr:GNAT family N-acetyltransferase [Chloroflexota bacterium]
MTLRARDIHEHLCAVGPWVDWERTCDGFKHGDPDTEVRGIAVGWQSLQSALQEAADRGCNLFITHEPTFYSHMDDDEAWKRTEPGLRKAHFLDETGMVVYRCHDVWDVYPELGIVDAWSAFLDLGAPVKRMRYYNLHEVPATTAWELTHRVAQRVAELGEQSAHILGCKWQMVRRLAVGTGAITNVRAMVEMGADVVLATDDGLSYWRDGAWAADAGIPVIVVNHMTAEIPGLRRLAEYLSGQFPEVPVAFVGPTCSYEIYATQRSREIPIRMRLDSLKDLPPVDLPADYELRSMRADETWAYRAVMNRSTHAGEADEAWFRRAFSDDPAYDPSYLQIIWRGDRPVAVAGAWHEEIDGEPWGVVHWVGVDRDERGKGLGKVIVLAALRRLRERGFDRAMLGTQDWRMPAIATYQRLGFRPWPDERATQAVWDRVLADLEAWRGQQRGDAQVRGTCDVESSVIVP